MSVIRWPGPFSEQGRLAEGEAARAMGKSALAEESPGCPQVLYVNLFFDGTNNNREWDIKDAKKPTHSNVARLFRACPQIKEGGIFSEYVPGVGTPFDEIGEKAFSSEGKAFALGFGMRVAWGYTRLMNALHIAMTGSRLLDDSDARALCSSIDADVIASNGTIAQSARMATKVLPVAGSLATASRMYHGYKTRAKLERLHGELSALQKKHSGPGGQLNRSIKKVWVNVFGFSRGAASARVFVNRLINIWAPDGMIAGSIPYEVNFLGIFDTVASVGLPDTVTAAINLVDLDGHWAWTAEGALNIPASVKKCVHFFSIHEQRMSFPLDSIREKQAYPVGAPRRIEVAYPGVHSDVGGGYGFNEEGKSREGDGSKLSQIALHNMYIEALKGGVPLLIGSEFSRIGGLLNDFSLHPSVARAFNDWLSTVNQKPLDSVESALRIGMGQSLAWRTLRADYGNPQAYITSQEFFRHAPEHEVTPYGLETRIKSKATSASRLDDLKREKHQLEKQKADFEAAALSMPAIPALANPFKKKAAELAEQIKKKDADILAAAAGKPPRPGEGTTDVMTNDKTDLLEAAEEFRLLLAYLYPDQRWRWQVYWALPPADTVKVKMGPIGKAIPLEQNANAYYLTVERKDVVSHRRQGSATAWMGERDRVMQLLGAVAPYQPILDFVLTPRPEMLPFLLTHTSDEAVRKLPRAAIRLLDDYVHDSRAWFRVPYFHEYAPGGYGWARTVFVGDDRRVRSLGLKDNASHIAVELARVAAADRGNYLAEQSRTLPPPVKVDFSTFPRH
ncbi:T6SS phospholipase effector Tle1-like catalytic domain-containing protein (plasmid) [Burkholderia ambifaria]